MRQCGYYFERQDKGELAFCRIISASKTGYPRFHAYVHPVKSDKVGAKQFNRVKINSVARQTYINLHLDQKKPVYKGAPAHSAEYEGEVVEKEAERIKKIIKGR